MPPLKTVSSTTFIYLGIDPGESGGLCCLPTNSNQPTTTKMPGTEKDIWDWIGQWSKPYYNVVAAIEDITPRPTVWFNPKTRQKQSSILKSTCLLYGNYLLLRGMILAAGYRLEAVRPQTWQKAMKIQPKGKKETNTEWKNRLRQRAQELFPNVKVTLYVADCLLVGEYIKRKYTGTL